MYPNRDCVPCFQSEYRGVTGSITTVCVPLCVSYCQELELSAVFVQILVTVTTGVVGGGHHMPKEHIGPRHRGREDTGGRVVPRPVVCFYFVVYNSFAVEAIGWCILGSKSNGSICKYETYTYRIWNEFSFHTVFMERVVCFLSPSLWRGDIKHTTSFINTVWKKIHFRFFLSHDNSEKYQ